MDSWIYEVALSFYGFMKLMVLNNSLYLGGPWGLLGVIYICSFPIGTGIGRLIKDSLRVGSNQLGFLNFSTDALDFLIFSLD